jgi:transposase-like protein
MVKRPLRELMDELLERSGDEAGGLRLTGEDSVLGDLVKALLERALAAELSAHLGYGKHEAAGDNSGYSRNGSTAKTAQTAVAPVRLVPRRDRSAVAAALKPVYTAPGEDAAWQALADFADTEWGRRYPQATRVWESFTPFLAFTPAVRKLLYATNAIESLNDQLRKHTLARGHFPTDEAAVKLLWLALVNIEDKRARERARRHGTPAAKGGAPQRLIEGQRTQGWKQVLTELDLAYPGRLQ